MQARAILKASFYALCIDKLCGVWVFSSIAFLTAVSAVVFQQTYVQEVHRHTEDFLKSEKMTAFSSVFPCMYILECPYLLRRMAFPVCVWGHSCKISKCYKSVLQAHLGSGCIAVKIVCFTVCYCYFSMLAPCYLQATLPTLILLSISNEHHIDNFLHCFSSVFCELFNQYCFACSLALVMFQGKALVLGLSDMKDTVVSHFQAENTQYIFIKALLKISMLVLLSLTLITFSLKVYT